MIERLAEYIREQGYSIRVFPESEKIPFSRVRIWLVVGDRQLTSEWALSKDELDAIDWSILKMEADYRLHKLTRAVQGAMRAIQAGVA